MIHFTSECFLWAQTIWIIYMWRCVKQLPNFGSGTSGATGSEPNAANCNKSVEKHLFFDTWVFITQAPWRMVQQNSNNCAFKYSTTSVSGSTQRSTKTLECAVAEKNHFLLCWSGSIQVQIWERAKWHIAYFLIQNIQHFIDIDTIRVSTGSTATQRLLTGKNTEQDQAHMGEPSSIKSWTK